MSQFICDSAPAYDSHGRINFMVRSGGYVMCRRPRAAPFVLAEKEWRKLPKAQDDGVNFEVRDARVIVRKLA
ncbi:hypothetical protein [Xanthomonas campestris]|uniref:hypothetical protein n=1 Tax=Xanthomonas campestris TaxID=339 RepID=UPI0005AF319E|nr:hypothetical protein [Xanthomonas campestris]KIQ21562.1 hypothetical protein RT95_20665 [Xanthomonas campestris]